MVLIIIFSFLWASKIRGERKIGDKQIICAHLSKTLSGFFLGFALFVLIGGIVGIIYKCITDIEYMIESSLLADSICIITVVSAIGFFGYAYFRFNYVVANVDGIIVCRLFRKKKFYFYEEIAYFKDTLSMGMIGSLIGYNKNGKKIFAIEGLYIGSSAIAQQLREHGVQEK